MMGLSMAVAILSEMVGFLLVEKALKHLKLSTIIIFVFFVAISQVVFPCP